MNDILYQALGLLFAACKPLTFDCLRTAEERNTLIREIEKITYYCCDVKECIDNKKKPPTYDEWLHGKVCEDYVNGNLFTKLFSKKGK